MILNEVRLTTREPITVWFLGDTHIGTLAADEGHLKRTIAMISRDPNAYFIFMGDGAECITPLDKRWSQDIIAERFQRSLDNLPQAQTNYLLDLLEPIKDKCLGYHGGNHETKILTATRGYDPLFDYNTLFPGKNLGRGMAVTRIIYETTTTHAIKILSQHGYGGATTDGAKFNRVKKMAVSWPDCHVYAMGHVHKLAVDSGPALDVPTRGTMRIAENRRLFVLTGCYLRTYTNGVAGYGEIRNYDATELGSPYIRFRDTHPSDKGPHVLSMEYGTSRELK